MDLDSIIRQERRGMIPEPNGARDARRARFGIVRTEKVDLSA